MRALINAKNIGSVVCRVAKESLAKALLDSSYEVDFDNENYQNYDLVIFFSIESKTNEVRKINPKAIIGILDPKLNKKRDYEEEQNADFLVVSSLEQQLFASQFNKNIVIYNWFSEINCEKNNKVISKKIRIGYQGNKIHLNAFSHCLKDAFESLYKEFKFIELCLFMIKNLGKWKIGRPKIPILDKQCNQSNYCDILSNCDIGILPNLLPLNKYLSNYMTRTSFRKSLYNYNPNDYLLRFKLNSNPNRFWEFSQLKIPVVADLFPSSCQVIEHDKNGYLAYDKNSWYESLKILIEQPEKRKSFGNRLYETINEKFSIECNQSRFIDFLFEKFRKLKIAE